MIRKRQTRFYKFLALRLRFTDKKVTFVMSSVIPANRVQPLVMPRGHEIVRKNKSDLILYLKCNVLTPRKVFMVSMGCLGPVQLVFAVINDYVSYGLSRSILYLGLILSYLILAVAEPSTSSLLYIWAIQWPFGLCKKPNRLKNVTINLSSMY